MTDIACSRPNTTGLSPLQNEYILIKDPHHKLYILRGIICKDTKIYTYLVMVPTSTKSPVLTILKVKFHWLQPFSFLYMYIFQVHFLGVFKLEIVKSADNDPATTTVPVPVAEPVAEPVAIPVPVPVLTLPQQPA